MACIFMACRLYCHCNQVLLNFSLFGSAILQKLLKCLCMTTNERVKMPKIASENFGLRRAAVFPFTAFSRLLHMTDSESKLDSEQKSSQSSSGPVQEKHFNNIKLASKLREMAPFLQQKMMLPRRQPGGIPTQIHGLDLFMT